MWRRIYRLRCLSLTLIILLNGVAGFAQEHIELGKVHWLRDYAHAQAKAQKADKPIFVLFQEVPGCLTCQNYGLQVLSHPLIVEAIETCFVPLAVFNNHGGKDREILDKYKEPTWNNPVVRMVDQMGVDIVSRHAGDYTASGLVDQMIQALEQAQRSVPTYLRIIQQELGSKQEEATMGMFCFWTGERTYGSMDGVLKTEAGFAAGHEVVTVTYDPQQISISDLLQKGVEHQCADYFFYTDEQQVGAAREVLDRERIRQLTDYRVDAEPQYYLLRSPFAQIPMSELQRTKANAMLGHGQDPSEVFSPRQLAYLQVNDQVTRYRSKTWKVQLAAGPRKEGK